MKVKELKELLANVDDDLENKNGNVRVFKLY